ncbi:MAG: major capsid protein [Oscillospiraceae bacterium]|nr:major capsid protein [Oscillospiraceae bacterium]
MDLFTIFYLIALAEEIVPNPSFFKDRYFPTTDEDIFAADEVLTEYRKGDRKMAAFVAERAGDIPVDRRGYEIRKYQPAYIAPSRMLTLDDLKKRGFGEALHANNSAAERAARILLQDMTDLDNRILRREEWMCAQTMLNNACEIQEYIDAETVGNSRNILFYDGTSEHVYTVGATWNANNGDFFGDVTAMCRMLSKRGLMAADLILGSQAADAVLNIDKVQKLLDNNRIHIGNIAPELTAYPGVAFMGTLNFGGFNLNLFNVNHSYVNDSGVDTPYFPTDGAMVTAPDCGRLMYGQISQIDHGNTEYSTHTGIRIPKLVIDQDKDTRKLRLGTRPLAAPKNYCPYIYAASVVT